MSLAILQVNSNQQTSQVLKNMSLQQVLQSNSAYRIHYGFLVRFRYHKLPTEIFKKDGVADVMRESLCSSSDTIQLYAVPNVSAQWIKDVYYPEFAGKTKNGLVTASPCWVRHVIQSIMQEIPKHGKYLGQEFGWLIPEPDLEAVENILSRAQHAADCLTQLLRDPQIYSQAHDSYLARLDRIFTAADNADLIDQWAERFPSTDKLKHLVTIRYSPPVPLATSGSDLPATEHLNSSIRRMAQRSLESLNELLIGQINQIQSEIRVFVSAELERVRALQASGKAIKPKNQKLLKDAKSRLETLVSLLISLSEQGSDFREVLATSPVDWIEAGQATASILQQASDDLENASLQSQLASLEAVLNAESQSFNAWDGDESEHDFIMS